MSKSASARLTAGFLLAACTPGFICALFIFLSPPGGSGLSGLLGGISAWVMMTSFITIPATFLPGVAAYFLYQGQGWRSWWSYLLGGALIGLACIVLPWVFISPSSLLAANFWQLAGLASLFGGLSALTLWFSIHAGPRFVLAAFGLACAGLLLNEMLR